MLATRTFLFSDLRDYTGFVEAHGDAAAAQLIADYRRIVRAEVAKREGAEVKTEGDSFYVVFTTTAAAVTCAAAILREADAYSRARPTRPMRVGVGIHSGEPVPHEGQFVGTAVIVAARLAQAAAGGELLITDVVRALLPRSLSFPMSERSGLALKGLETPPTVFAVDWRAAAPERQAWPAAETAIPASAPTSRQLLCPVVVGRDAELASLEGHLLEAVAGRGRAVLVAGEAGLGKSALTQRFTERARAHGARLLLGECTEIDARRPFGPFVDALVSAGIELPGELEGGGPGALPIAEVERYRVHLGFADRLAAAARERPLALVIEDLHWADDATYELVPYLARRLRDQRVLLVATYRSDELHRLHPLNHVLAELSRGRLATEIRLRRLTLEETGDVIRRTLMLTQPPTAEFRAALFERTEGNPFFIEEILGTLVERGELKYRDGAWRRIKSVAELAIPATVRDAVQQRLLSLEPRARRAIQVAAIVGQRFDVELVAEVSGIDESAAFEAVKAAIDAQLVREEAADGGESYAFRHALSREAVLAELLGRERRLLHRAVGEAIERVAGAHPDARAEELAYHFDEARDGPRAYRYHELAAVRSTGMGAPRDALRHFERAVELAPDDDPALGPLLMRLADVATSVADNTRALRAADQARALAAQRNDRGALGEALARVSLFRWMAGDTKGAEATAREGIALLEPHGASAGLAACYTELARLAMLDSREPDAVSWGERAIAMARETGAIEAEIQAQNFVGAAMAANPGTAEEGVRRLRLSQALAEEHDRPYLVQRALNNLVAVLIGVGRSWSEVKAVHEESVRHAQQHGLRIDPLILRESVYAFAELDFDRALGIIDEARSDTIWSTCREGFELDIQALRDGPNEALLVRADDVFRRLLGAGDRQWIRASGGCGFPFYLAGRDAGALERARPARSSITRGVTGLGRGGTAAYALASSRRSGNDEELATWLETLDAARTFAEHPGNDEHAKGIRAWQAGDLDEAIRRLAAARRWAVEEHAPLVEIPVTAELLDALVAAERGADAARIVAEVTQSMRSAKPTWYLARLAAWAADHGLAVPT